MINIPLNSNWLEVRAQKSSDHTAVKTNLSLYSYSVLFEKVLSLTNHLIRSGIKRNNNVALVLNNDIDFIVSLFSVWNCGGIVVPLNPDNNANELKEQIEFVDSKYIITTRLLSESLVNLSGHEIILIDEIDLESKVENITLNNFIPGFPSIIMFTSGSSGLKKAAVLNFKNLYASSKNIDDVFDFKSGEKWLASLPFYHIGGLQIILRSILSGGELIIPQTLNSENITDAYNNFHPHYISVVNTTLQRIVEQNISPHKNLKAVFAGGGPIDTEILRSAIDKKLPVYKVYGSTETSSMITLLEPEETKRKTESTGKPLSQNSIKIFDEERNELSTNQPGEIAVKGESVFSGYYNNQSLNRKVFYKNYFFTGDIGYLDEDGYLYVVGRKDNFIITGGEKVNPSEVEQAMLELEYIEEVKVLGIEDKKWGETVCAAYTLKQNMKFNESEMKEKLKTKLASYKIPKKFLRLNSFPKTGLGKIDTVKLKQMITGKVTN